MNQPVTLQLPAAGGALAVRVTAHSLRSGPHAVPCWTYQTVGLVPLGHREIVFSLLRPPNAPPDAFPRDPVSLFEAIHAAAARGQRADLGGFTEFGPQGFFNRPHIRGLGYIRTEPNEGAAPGTLPPDALTAIALVGEELEVARACGLTRVTARLGQQTTHYPCPPWCDPDRPPMCDRRAIEQSILRGVAGFHASRSDAVMRGTALTLRLSRALAGALAQSLPTLPPNATLAFFLQPAPDATACLVWSPGQQGPMAIAPQGQGSGALSGGFVACVPQQQADGVQMFEDGFAVLLRDASWAALRDALARGQPFALSATQPAGTFALEWTDDPPVAAAAAPARPASPASELTARVQTPPHELATRLAQNDLYAYLGALEPALQSAAATLARGAGTNVWLQIRLAPQSMPWVQIAARPELEPNAARGLYGAAVGVAAPPVQGGPVDVLCGFTLWGGNGEALGV